ncbi:MAG: hypothetical protein WC477_03455 [Patescibacteria group bacterium]
MNFTSTLDLLYLVIAIGVLWVAAMLTWLLFEAALALRHINRFMAIVHKKAMWIEKKFGGIGERLESSSTYINAIAKGGKLVADYMKERREREDDDEDRPRRKRRR